MPRPWLTWVDLLGPTDLLSENNLDNLPSVAVCSGPLFVAAGVGVGAGFGAGISFSADFRRLVHGLESRNFSRRDLVLVNRDFVSPLSSWLLKSGKRKISFFIFDPRQGGRELEGAHKTGRRDQGSFTDFSLFRHINRFHTTARLEGENSTRQCWN